MTVSAASQMTRISENWPKFARQVLAVLDTKLDNTGDTPASGTYNFASASVIMPAGEQTVAGGAGTGATMLKTAGNINRQVSPAGVFNGADTTEDTLFTFSLPASAFDSLGRGVLITAFGSLGANAHTKTVKLYFGSSIVQTLSAATIASSAWNMQLMVYKGSALNTQIGQGQSILGAAHNGASNFLAGAETESGAIVIKVTGQSGTGGNGTEIAANLLEVEFFN